MVTTLQNFWLKHRKIIIIGGLLILGALILPHLVHAAPPPSPAASPAETPEDVGNKLLDGMSKILKLLQVIFWPILLMIGSLMQNDILFGAGMEQRLLEIWVNIRNIVNILFVLILLGIALYNVVGAGENYHFKTILPKFVIALIAVNFTFIGAKMVLDGVNILSTAIFALPDSVQEQLKAQTTSGGSTTPMAGILTVEEADGMCAAIYGGTPGQEPYNTNVNKANEKEVTSLCSVSQENGTYLRADAVSFFSKMNAKNAALVMALALGRSNLLDKVYVNEQSPTVGKLFTNTMFSIVLYVVYGTAFIALFVTLLIRLVVLWVMIAVSPLVVLPAVLPESIKGMLGEGGDLGKKFVKNAIVPIPVALVMSIGFVMLKGLQSAKLSASDKFINNPTLSLDLLTSGLSTLQDLIIAFGMVAFVWIGVFEAMKGTYAEGITGSIKGMVEGAGKTLGKFAVGSIPLFPTAKGPASIGEVGVALQQLPNIPRAMWQKGAAEKFPSIMLDTAAAGRKLGEQKNMKDLQASMGAVSRSGLRDKDVQAGLRKYFTDNAKDKPELEKNLRAMGYTKGVEQFLKDLEKNQVSQEDMEKLWRQMGVPLGAEKLPPGQKPGEEEQKRADRNAFMGRRKQLKDSGVPIVDETGKAVSDSDLDKLQKDLSSKDEKVRKAAEEKLDKIVKATKPNEDAASTMTATVKEAVQDNTKGTPTNENADKLGKKLQAKIDELVKGGMKQEDAEKKVMDAAASEMTKERADALEKVAAGDSTGIVKKLVDRQRAGGSVPPPKPGTGGAKPAAPPPKPGTGGGGAKPPAPPPPPPKPPKNTAEAKPTFAGTASGQESPGRNWVYDAAANAGKGDWINNPNP